MKKSKILAISLGTVALSTIAISTPLIITSCSNETFENVTLREDFVFGNSFTIEGDSQTILETFDKGLYSNNEININSKEKEPSFSLIFKTLVKNVISTEDITKHKLDGNATINWNLDKWTQTQNLPSPVENEQTPGENVEFVINNVKTNSSYTLIGSIGDSFKFKVNVNINFK